MQLNLRKGALSLAILFDDLPYTFVNVSHEQVQAACEADQPLGQAHVLNLQMYLEHYHLQIIAHLQGYTLRRRTAHTLNQVTDTQWDAHQQRMNAMSMIERDRNESRLQG